MGPLGNFLTNAITQPSGGIGVLNPGAPGALKYAPQGAPAQQQQQDLILPGGGTGAAQQQQQTDPYAKWGGQAAYNTLKSGFDTQKSNIYGSSNDAAAALQGGLANNVQKTIHGLTVGQQGIDRQNVQNLAAKMQGTQGILQMVGQGIKSGGVMLANKNAGSSSAAGALAAAYGDQGRRQLSQIGNQFEAQKGNIGVAQAEQDYNLAQAPKDFHTSLMDNVNGIVSSARDKFAQLDAAMANASLPDRIAIDQEKEAVRAQVLGQLQQYDTQLQQGVGGIRAAGEQQNIAAAQHQQQAGIAPESAFNYSQIAPAQAQGTGPFASTLPLFSNYGKKQIA